MSRGQAAFLRRPVSLGRTAVSLCLDPFTRYAPHARQHSAWRSPRQEHENPELIVKRLPPVSQLPSTSIYILGGPGHSHLTSKSDFRDLCGSKNRLRAHPGAALQKRGAPRRRSQRRPRPFSRVLATATLPPASVEREGSERVGQFELCGSVR